MKKFKVKRNNKTYIVQAKDAVHATKLADAATQLATINALVTDEQAAISAYNVAIENLNGIVDPKYIEVLRSIVKEENKHIENLQAIITGNVTEKNVEDSMKDADIEDLLKQAIDALRKNEFQRAANLAWNFITILKSQKLAK